MLLLWADASASVLGSHVLQLLQQLRALAGHLGGLVLGLCSELGCCLAHFAWLHSDRSLVSLALPAYHRTAQHDTARHTLRQQVPRTASLQLQQQSQQPHCRPSVTGTHLQPTTSQHLISATQAQTSINKHTHPINMQSQRCIHSPSQMATDTPILAKQVRTSTCIHPICIRSWQCIHSQRHKPVTHLSSRLSYLPSSRACLVAWARS